ncbi:MAG: DNA-directed RNA polymerase subunit omega [Candidatus Latescibacteria bacterium 4484_7]|nr:MAG: DNA-directed RNA polymerase subunit omega [Candidatus Latescibacteria bacterium 4484_7]
MDIKAMEKILERVPNRYEAVRIMAKDARRINLLIRLSGEEIDEKPTTIAMKRLIEGKVKYRYVNPEEES